MDDVGGAGRDSLKGEAGGDVFQFAALADTGNSSSTRDKITDFTAGQDAIDVAMLDADSSADGNQTFGFIGTAMFGGAAGELRFQQPAATATAGAKTIVSGDLDGDGFADFQIELSGLVLLSAADFSL